MAASREKPSNPPEHKSLAQALAEAFPSTFTCKTRYVTCPARPCEPLFSALPGQPAEETRVARHFLAISVDAPSLPRPGSGDVIGFAIEVLLYSTARLTTIFVSKVDSTSYLPRRKPSPIRTTVTTFLKWLAAREQHRHPGRTIVLSLFARAQAQYLFPGSSDHTGKHVLDDRQLIKWWARVLDPILSWTAEGSHPRHRAYITVPGYEKSELRQFMPSHSGGAGETPRWVPGNPLPELARARRLPPSAPPRCLLPRFPDDPKARFISDLDDEVGISHDVAATVTACKRKSGKWKSVVSLDQFWEQMEFRQECSSGRVVGFLWLVISSEEHDDDLSEGAHVSEANVDGQESRSPTPVLSSGSISPEHSKAADGSLNRKKRKKKKKRPRTRLAGPVIPRLPKVKSTTSKLSGTLSQAATDPGDAIVITTDGYEKAMSVLLQLDFANLDIASQSTRRWAAQIRDIAGLSEDFGVEIVGTAEAESADAGGGTHGPAPINDLGGLVKEKKRKVDDASQEAGTAGANDHPPVNLLGGAMVRKKAKPAVS